MSTGLHSFHSEINHLLLIALQPDWTLGMPHLHVLPRSTVKCSLSYRSPDGCPDGNFGTDHSALLLYLVAEIPIALGFFLISFGTYVRDILSSTQTEWVRVRGLGLG